MSVMKNKQDFISELFYQTNLGEGLNPPFWGSTEKLIPFSFTILNVKGVLGV